MDHTITITINLYWLAIAFILYLFLKRYLHRHKIKNIHDKYVLITGCDTGFGHRAAVRFSHEGCRVIAACLTEEGCQEVKRKGKDIHAVKMDVSDISSIEEACENVKKILPIDTGLWGVINNAGMTGNLGPIDWLSHDDVTKVIQVNVTGTISVTKTFLPLLKKECGRVINVASIVGLVNVPYNGVYSVSKHAVESLSDCLRIELEPFGVRVVVIEPGAHRTALVRNIGKLINTSWQRLSAEKRQEYGEDYLNKVLYLGCDLISGLVSSNVDQIVDAYYQALFCVNPSRRYMVGFDTKFLRFMAYLPDWLTDGLLRLPGLRAKPAAVAR